MALKLKSQQTETKTKPVKKLGGSKKKGKTEEKASTPAPSGLL